MPSPAAAAILRRLSPVLFILAAMLLPTHAGAQEFSRETGGFHQEDPLVAFARRWDINGDRIYTCLEWELFLKRIFHKADRNRDNLLAGDEVKAVVTADEIFSDASLAYFDMNDDGEITLMEFVSRPNPFFIIYDANKDCRVTAAELDRK